jgi:tRNA(adenine34) deaminase
MTPEFSELDTRFMQMALDQANLAAGTGNYPVGAVLVVNGQVIAAEHNKKENKADRISHAEMLLIQRHSQDILRWEKVESAKVELFTTFEPCLMCLGVSVIHRIHRIVVACRDPRGNISAIQPKSIGVWYERNWPRIEYGLLFEQSFDLLFAFFSNRKDDEGIEAAKLFVDMRVKGIA